MRVIINKNKHPVVRFRSYRNNKLYKYFLKGFFSIHMFLCLSWSKLQRSQSVKHKIQCNANEKKERNNDEYKP